MPDKVFVAVVQYGDDVSDRGAVYMEDGQLIALYPDGGDDRVFRDRRGWLWDEYGDAEYPARRGDPSRDADGNGRGTRLRVVSRCEADAINLMRSVGS